MIPASIDISGARLPAAYEHAKNALAVCSSVDECQEWANKAEALASYAKQADDDTLRKMADRIQARAVRRCGELLKQYDARQGQNLPNAKNDGTDSFSRRDIAAQAGMSERQQVTAVRVANVPEDRFENAVDGDAPPTVTALAAIGTKKRPDVSPAVEAIMTKVRPAGFGAATELLGTVEQFAQFCRANDATTVAGAVMPHETADLRKHVATIDAWLDRFVVNLGE